MESEAQGVTVAEAAELLGISADAVRKRVQRGTLQGYKVAGQWYVIPNGAGQASRQRQDNRPDGQDATTGHVQDSDQTALVEALQEHIAFLQAELVRKDQLLAAMTQRIPLLEAPRRRPWWRFWERVQTEDNGSTAKITGY